jgi:hypothetical protein
MLKQNNDLAKLGDQGMFWGISFLKYLQTRLALFAICCRSELIID